MTRRRLERLEDRAGLGRAAWAAEAAKGERLALEAVRARGGDARQVEAVRRAFAGFRAVWRPGASGEEKARAADVALDVLEEALDPAAFALALALLSAAAE
ncbi:hypothetical protein QOL99_02965 [Deinococcus sp. MIMF12]|uniref:Uncharacterized protein n=1 Tax=Deinococcus rhizophilus TaxID=3049544 RepID=A0ABT7JDT0_9DEIO|nr:hypothetical protein [Deinococcus rhizophilus]MDL2343106.1 hypothetical protein [Deinococcus rhizophilus]